MSDARLHKILSGPALCSLMRRHKVTIRTLAKRHNLTLKRIREVRRNGVRGFAAEEWCYLVSGEWPDAA